MEFRYVSDYALHLCLDYMKHTPKPFFRVTFEDLGERTGITVESLSGIVFARTKDIDLFWEKKLGAKRLKRQ